MYKRIYKYFHIMIQLVNLIIILFVILFCNEIFLINYLYTKKSFFMCIMLCINTITVVDIFIFLYKNL